MLDSRWLSLKNREFLLVNIAPIRLGASKGKAFYCPQYMPRLPSWQSLIQAACPLIMAPQCFSLVVIARFGYLPANRSDEIYIRVDVAWLSEKALVTPLKYAKRLPYLVPRNFPKIHPHGSWVIRGLQKGVSERYRAADHDVIGFVAKRCLHCKPCELNRCLTRPCSALSAHTLWPLSFSTKNCPLKQIFKIWQPSQGLRHIWLLMLSNFCVA